MKSRFVERLGCAAGAFVLYAVFQAWGAGGAARVFPAAVWMGYGLALAPALAAAVYRSSAGFPAGQGRRYSAGRVILYPGLGAAAGVLGAVYADAGLSGALAWVSAGALMVIAGFGALGLFPSRRGAAGWCIAYGSVLTVGLYAFLTGSPGLGALGMLIFGLGTAPFVSGGSARLRFAGRFAGAAGRCGGMLAAALGFWVVAHGLGLGGFQVPAFLAGGSPRQGAAVAGGEVYTVEAGVQILRTALSPGRYPAITVQAGLPVRWLIDAPEGSVNRWNSRVFIGEYGIDCRFTVGENTIAFTPERTGTFAVSSVRGMPLSFITVIPLGEGLARSSDDAFPPLRPTPAGVRIPADRAELAEPGEGGQALWTALEADGFRPALLVVQRGITARLTLSGDFWGEGETLLVPAYYTKIDLEAGETVIEFFPSQDFAFSAGEGRRYGYVKVVEDLRRVDLEAVKKEVADFEPQQYPAAYFAEVRPDRTGGGGCCGGSLSEGSASFVYRLGPPGGGWKAEMLPVVAFAGLVGAFSLVSRRRPAVSKTCGLVRKRAPVPY
jgi:sulfite exporter TauE/SafE